MNLCTNFCSIFSTTLNTELGNHALDQVHCWGAYFRRGIGHFENFYPFEFVATCVFETKTARISLMHFRTVGGQDSHVHGVLLIGSGAICK